MTEPQDFTQTHSSHALEAGKGSFSFTFTGRAPVGKGLLCRGAGECSQSPLRDEDTRSWAQAKSTCSCSQPCFVPSPALCAPALLWGSGTVVVLGLCPSRHHATLPCPPVHLNCSHVPALWLVVSLGPPSCTVLAQACGR